MSQQQGARYVLNTSQLFRPEIKVYYCSEKMTQEIFSSNIIRMPIAFVSRIKKYGTIEMAINELSN